MNFQSNPRTGILISGMILIFIFSAHWVELIMMPDDIWWTPTTMLDSLDEGSERIEIYVRDDRFQDIINSGKLVLETDTGTEMLTSSDISLRFNNYDRVRASKIWNVALDAVATTAALIMVIFGAIPLFIKESNIEITEDNSKSVE